MMIGAENAWGIFTAGDTAPFQLLNRPIVGRTERHWWHCGVLLCPRRRGK